MISTSYRSQDNFKYYQSLPVQLLVVVGVDSIQHHPIKRWDIFSLYLDTDPCTWQLNFQSIYTARELWSQYSDGNFFQSLWTLPFINTFKTYQTLLHQWKVPFPGKYCYSLFCWFFFSLSSPIHTVTLAP